jgi:Fe2+ transport system protein B
LGKELGAKCARFSLIQSMILAWVVSFLIYQVGTLLIH